MLIVSLAAKSESSLSVTDVRELAAQLNIDVSAGQDAEDYFILLKLFEAIMQHTNDVPDVVHPNLELQPVVGNRTYWKPNAKGNPLNAWSHQCNLRSRCPTSNLLASRTIAVKDNIFIGGLPTTLGTFTKILANDGVLPMSPIDASVVSRVLAACAVIEGSSTCENFRASPVAFSSAMGPVHYPLLHGYTTGGSSSGSCALVAAKIWQDKGSASLGKTVELAIGVDQAGSVMIPASFTGLYGLKPTFGLMPYTGAASMSLMIDHLGPIASNLEDIASLLKVMAGYGGLDPLITPESPLLSQVKDYQKLLAQFRAQTHAKPSALQVGLLTESFNIAVLSPEVGHVVRHAAKKFFEAAGVQVLEVSVPMRQEGPLIWTASTRPSLSE